jgi:hypothetical protein
VRIKCSVWLTTQIAFSASSITTALFTGIIDIVAIVAIVTIVAIVAIN